MDATDISRLFDHLPGYFAVVRAEPGFPIVAMSPALRAVAVNPGNPRGRPIFDLFPEAPDAPGSVASQIASFERVIETRSPHRHEHRYDVVDAASGRFVERYWVATNTPILDAHGDVEYILHQGEEAAIGRRQDSMAILDAMTEGVYTVDRLWRFNYVNPEAYRILRREPGSLVGGVIWDLFPGAEHSEFGEHYRRTMQERTTSSFTAFYDGLQGWYEVTAYPAPEGISVYFRDVTARVLAELDRARLSADSEHQRRIYETALNNTPDFVYVFGTDHRAIYANDALRKVWGVDDVRGKVWMELGYEQWHADMHDREIDQVIATKAPIRGEIPFAGTNGRRMYDYIFAPVLDAAGEVVAIAGTTRDITERQAAEQIIREHADQLEQADRAKDEFLATLSHELRNPLAPLRNGVEILKRSTSPTPQEQRVHLMMERQVDHLVRLVDDLMEVSRITRGKISLQCEPVAIADVIDSALEAARPLIDLCGHELVVDLPGEEILVHGDRVRLAQILTNLLNNAAKYSEPGGRVAVHAAREGDVVAVRVVDRGIGMEPTEVPLLFEMFTRGDRVKATHQGGLGIGLSLARRLAASHGGTLEGFSEGPGLGSTFELRLPVLAERAHALPSPGVDPAPLALRILIADDNRDVGESLAEALRGYGAEIRLVGDGVSALDNYGDFQPDVAILDIGMPRVTGYDVARMLRSRGATQPLIALTGWGQAEDRQRAFASGFDHHLVKPVAIPMLLELLRSIERTGARARQGQIA